MKTRTEMMNIERNEFIDLNRKIGYALGVLKGILLWNIPEELKIKIKVAIEEIESDLPT